MTQLYAAPPPIKHNAIRYFLLLIAVCLTHYSFAQPVISSFTPVSAPVGAMVTIDGSNFSSAAANDIVYFGAVKATVSNATATSLTVTVPMGASYQPITVTTNHLTAWSSQPFRVTFTGGTPPFTASSMAGYASAAGIGYPYQGAIGDIDGDGKPDIAIPAGYSTAISVLRNTSSPGAITFSKTDFTAANYPRNVNLGDINGDGKLDMAAANSQPFGNSISVFINTSSSGSISFATRIDLPLAGDFTDPQSILVQDIDGDGKADIAEANTAGTLAIFRNTSSASAVTFDTVVSFTTYGNGQDRISSGDIDGDGKVDLLISNSAYGLVSIFRNTSTPGTLSFAPKIDIPAGSAPFGASVGDVDGDGKPDMAVVNANDNTIYVYKNTSTSGSISFANFISFFSGGTTPSALSMTDMNGDGKPDLVAANSANNTVTVLKNTSAGGQISFDPGAAYTAGSYPYGLSINDLDGDGVPDISIVNRDGNNVTVLRNQVQAPNILSFTPKGTRTGEPVNIFGTNFTAATAVSFGGIAASSYTVLSDTAITAIVGTGASGNVSVTTPLGVSTVSGFVLTTLPTVTALMPNTGGVGSTIILHGSNFTGASAVSFGGVAATSFTVQSDTTISAVVGVVPTGDLTVSVTNSSGSASLSPFYSGPIITAFNPQSGPLGTTVTLSGHNFSANSANNIVYFGSVKAPVVSSSTTSVTAAVPAGAIYGPISINSNNFIANTPLPFTPTFAGGAGPFSATSFAAPVTAPAGNYPVKSFTGDLNGDGKPDVVVPNAMDNTLSILRNTSTGGAVSFAPKADISTIVSPSSVSFGDIDGDGKIDMVVTNSSGGGSSISIFRNTTSGTNITFAAAVNYGTGITDYSYPNNTTIMDLDGDGRLDIAVANGDNTMTVYRNTSTIGSISLGIKQNYPVGPNAQSVCASDLDGDGKPDLVTANSGVDNTVSVFRNTSSIGSISFTPALTLTNFAGPYSVVAGDMDGDGLADLAVVNANYVFDGTSYINTVSVLKNTSSTGTISFAPRVEYRTGGYGSYPVGISIGDLDGDGKPDLAMANRDDNTVSVLRNTGGGGAISFDKKVDYTPGARPISISVIDMNADGRPDLVTANEDDHNISVLTNQTSSTPIPVLTSFSPVSASQGNTVTIKGSHFTGTTTVSLGGLPVSSFTVVSDTTITAIVGNGNTGAVNVITPGGSASLVGFTYIGLKITSFNPASAKEETAITIRGTHFTGATAVSFGSTPAQSFTVVSDTVITAVVGTGSTGEVAITGPMGIDSLAGFTFIDTTASTDTTTLPPPSTALHMTSFTPASASQGGTITIHGSHFSGATAVSFGPTPAAAFTVVSDSTITAIVGTGSSGQVFVTGPAGIDSLGGFTFVNNPGGIDTTTPPPPAPPAFRLVSFTGTVSANQPVLSWQAADDPGIDYYVVEYSVDSTNFSATGSVKAVGKDTSTISYSYVDPAPRNFVIYYRLKIEDTTGKVTYSKVIAVHLTGFAPTLSVSPNPVNAYLTAVVPNAAVSSQFQLTDMMGQITRSVKVAPNISSVRIDVTNLTEGVYKLIWSDGVNYSYQTILILR